MYWRKLGFSAFGTFLGVSVYKRLEIKNNIYIQSPINSYGSIQSLASKVFSTSTSTSSRSSFNFKLFNLGILGLLLFINFVKWAIFGKLSPTEIRNLKHKINYTIWEFAFGFMIFYVKSRSIGLQVIQNELFKFAGLFFSVLLLKCFHYLSIDRVSSIFNTNSNSRAEVKYQGLRLFVGLIILAFIDNLLISRFLYEVYQNYYWSDKMIEMSKVTLQENILTAIFGFEILHIGPLIFLTILKYCLDFYEYFHFHSVWPEGNAPLTTELELNTWKETKMKIIYVTEFVVNLLRFTMLCIFSIVFLSLHTFPFHILPSSYLSLRVLVVKTRQLINFKKKQFTLKKLTIPATLEDHSEQCVICFDSLENDASDLEEIRGLRHCGHHFHYECLKTWINYSRSCPICREKI
ncbi:hypothetical protein G9P44_006146 [Scheffersomyces stipitis]|nr:hypothetical protein G9P44_006146 [Scheffersomyces stipitis]